MPAPSLDREAQPALCNSSMTGSMLVRVAIIADSVISIMSQSGFSPKDSIVASTWRIAVGCQKEAGRLMET